MAVYCCTEQDCHEQINALQSDSSMCMGMLISFLDVHTISSATECL